MHLLIIALLSSVSNSTLTYAFSGLNYVLAVCKRYMNEF